MARKKKLPPGVRLRDGRYTYRYSVEVFEDGIVRRKQKETPAYATAEEAYNEGILIKARQLQGTYIDETNMTLEGWYDIWIQSYEESGKKKHTIKSRKSRAQPILKQFGKKKLKEITAMQYQNFLYDLKRNGKKKNTLLATHAVASLLFRTAAAPPYELIQKDITEHVVFPTYLKTVEELEAGEETFKYLEKEELALFLKTAFQIADEENDPLERLVLREFARSLWVLAYTGLRIGELCSLERTRINEVNLQIRIIKTLYAMEGVEKFELETPKNDGSVRTVDVTKQVITMLHEQEKERKQIQLMCTRYYDGRPFCFVNGRRKPGYPISPRDIERFMKDVLIRAGLPTELTPHSLRHTYTSLCAEAGIELASIQRQLGHINDKTTTMIYRHVTKARRRADVEKLDALLKDL
ncbi:site-specific recombinase XerD [Paenibacillus cellulosilyticus]|uniref:Site-specific recombinase XerD n=1 Tax=Paenibacillus cellulosilyticus TaxID=375489 RepID=A0A2V2YNY2_9BACL|nr:site-specific integrase [Paenibacillus cellulosilyticus]PWV97476.1 site-specific recombinase XerD [Paenibacillus cellulosilyticus]QKS48487.1 site-specific integrase [Paenibacillus cellulosilyticus]